MVSCKLVGWAFNLYAQYNNKIVLHPFIHIPQLNEGALTVEMEC